jgi:hypothetical protein
VINGQLTDIRARFPEATVCQLPSGAALVTVPDFEIAPGWSARRTTVRFLAPVGYPYAAPDCFWADAELRLANGTMPQNSAINPIPETSLQGLWFSWHLQKPWNPNVDCFLTWLATIDARFRSAK